MLEAYCRPLYQKFLVDPIAIKFHRGRWVPTAITLFGCSMGLLCIPFLWYGLIELAIGSLLISGYLDTLDGTLARLNNQSTPKGAVLDIICDRIVEFAVIAGLYSINPINRGWASIGMLGSVLICVTSFLVVGIFIKNECEKSFHYSAGLMERTEAFIFFILMILIPNWFNELAVLFIILVTATGIRRIWQFLKYQ